MVLITLETALDVEEDVQSVKPRLKHANLLETLKVILLANWSLSALKQTQGVLEQF